MPKENKKLKIDFLYLDLSTCDRCRATDKVLDDALDELRKEVRGVKEVTINRIKIETDEEAKRYDFFRSPTIRINGIDIEKILSGRLEIKDDYCKSCASVCDETCSQSTGGGTQCRTVEYRGKIYEAVPKEMIKDAIMKVLGIKTKEDPKKGRVESSCCVPK